MENLSQENLERLIKSCDISPTGYRDEHHKDYLDISGWYQNGLLVYEPFLKLIEVIPCLFEYSGKKGTHPLTLFKQLTQIVPWVKPGKPAYYLALHACGFPRSRDRCKYGNYNIFAKLIDLSQETPTRDKFLKKFSKYSGSDKFTSAYPNAS